MSNQWVFGYGSLIFRPDFAFLESAIVEVNGFERRFWQGSHDHRGVPDAPGRVVTLIEQAHARCRGVAYLIDATTAAATFDALDHREKNGYTRLQLPALRQDDTTIEVVAYIATSDNVAFLGDASVADIAEQIAISEGPSGRNSDYLFDLAQGLRSIQADDDHVFALETAVRAILDASDFSSTSN